MSDIQKRLIAHNHPGNKGWTKKNQPLKIIYQEIYENNSEALTREKQLKSAKEREFIKTFIPGNE
ncbi:MAG: GIY-YIG nuclease family protein [Paludibacter sp.]